MFKKIICLICALILISGCSTNSDNNASESFDEITSINKDNYSILLPFDVNTSRYWFSNSWSKLDALELPKGLQDASKKHFSVNDNYLSVGSMLSYDDIQMLQRRESATYPYALNPPEGMFQINDAQEIDSPYIVSGVYEIDFYSKKDPSILSGISVAIIMDDTLSKTIDGITNKYTISQEYLMAYGSTIGHKLERYLRTKPGVEPDLPIYVMLYDAQTSTSYIPGDFFADGIFTGRSGQFNKINEAWYIVPSSEFSNVDGILASKFSTIKNLVNQFMPENVSMVGRSKFVDDTIQYLDITITVQAKNYTEIYALAQYVSELAKSFDYESMHLIIEIKQMDETMFIINKDANSKELSLLDMN